MASAQGAAGTFSDSTVLDVCATQDASAGFSQRELDPSAAVTVLALRASATQGGMDAVVGIGGDSVSSFNDFAASVRFWTDGSLQVRDGNVYRADTDARYQPGQDYQFRFVIDLLTKTYSVYVYGPGAFVELARGYRFRPQQAGIAELSTFASVVDSAGQLTVCGVAGGPAGDASFYKLGSYKVLPIAGEHVLLTDGATRTIELDEHGLQVRSVNRGGALAIAPTGYVFMVRLGQGPSFPELTVDYLTPSLSRVWTRTFNIAPGQVIRSLGVYSCGDLAVALGNEFGVVNGTVVRIGREGASHGVVAYAEAADVAITASGFVLASWGKPHRIEHRSIGGALVAQHTYPGNYDIVKLAAGPDGSFTFFGQNHEEIDLGTGPIQFYGGDGPENSFVAGFSSTGTARFAQNVDSTWYGGIFTDGARVVFARHKHIGAVYNEYLVWNAAGALEHVYAYGLTNFSTTSSVAITPAGRVFATTRLQWPDGGPLGSDYTVAYEP